jgi:hypothetical protein
MAELPKPTVFVSYSHKDELWKERLRPHLGVLEQFGHITIWDDHDIGAGADWYDEIKRVIEWSRVNNLQQAGRQDQPPCGLLTRAALHRARAELTKARRDLEEALAIATRGGMRLYEADCHLEVARFHLACGEREAAREPGPGQGDGRADGLPPPGW